MKPCLFNIFAAVSLLLCFATTVLWVRSYWVEDYLDISLGTSHQVSLVAYKGQIGCELMQWFPDTNFYNTYIIGRSEIGFQHYSMADVASRDDIGIVDWNTKRPILGWHNVCGFRFHVYVSGTEYDLGELRAIAVPAWFIVGCTGVIPIRFAITFRKYKARKRQGACFFCGYDLRATPDRCPECGEVPKKTERIST